MSSLDIDNESRNKIVTVDPKNLRSLFVEAGAGSGKTTMLVNRMIAMVEADIPVNEIAAITFTKAAATEFFERFQQLLIERSNPNAAEKWEEDVRKNGTYAGQLPKPDAHSIECCSKALKNIDLCFMGTIDSFCNMILSEHPSEAGLVSDCKLISSVDMKFILEQMYVKICNGLYGDELTKIAKAFSVVNRNAVDVFTSGVSTLAGHRNAVFDFPAYTEHDIDAEFASDREKIIKAAKCLLEHQEIAYIRNASWDHIKGVYTALNTRWSKNFTSVMWALGELENIKLQGFAMKLYGPVLSEFYEEKRDKKRNIYYSPTVRKVGKDINPNGLSTRLREIQYEISMAFLGKCTPKIVEYLHDEGYLSYFDYQYYLLKTLREDAAKDGKLISYISKRHKYFLVDEFQDTDPMQAEILFYLTATEPKAKWYECVPRPGSLFIVGDPKQSIYRFRNADVASYLRVRRLFEAGAGDVLLLPRNFRSKRCLCEYFNNIFSGLFADAASINQSTYEAIPIPPASEPDLAPAVGAGEFSGIYQYSIGDDKSDPEAIADMIRILVNNDKYKIKGKKDKEPRPINYNDIMVITYSKKPLDAIMSYFFGLKIPVKVEGKVLFNESKALHEIYRLYSVVADPYEKAAVYGALTGSVFALTKEELLTFVTEGGVISILDKQEEKDLKSDTAKKVYGKLKELEGLYAEAQNLTPSSLLSFIMDKYEIFTVTDTDNLEVLYYSAELVRNAENSGIIVTLKDGKEYLHKLLKDDTDVERCLNLNPEDNRVHLANLHKVKGLEAPVVILAKGKTGGRQNSRIRMDYSADEPRGFLFKLQDDDYKDLFSTSGFSDEKEEEDAEADDEEVRKLYVAATRAKNTLIVAKCDRGRWNRLIPFGTAEIMNLLDKNDIKQPVEKEHKKATELYAQAEKDFVLSDVGENHTASFTLESPSGLKVLSKNDDDKDTAAQDSDPSVSGAIGQSDPSSGADPSSDSGKDDAGSKSKFKPFADLIGTMVHKQMECIVSTSRTCRTEDPALIKAEMLRNVEDILDEYVDLEKASYMNLFRKQLCGVTETIFSGGYAQVNGLEQDILKLVLGADEVYCEVPFSYREPTGGKDIIWNGIIDLLVRIGDEWFIIDYKTNADGTNLDYEYQNQLNAYIKAFKMASGITAKALIYHIDV